MIKALRDNLALLALLATLVGVSSTDSYYTQFGLRYQSLDLGADHILYRGLTSAFSSWAILCLYLIATSCLVFQARIALLFRRHWLKGVNYLLVMAFGTFAWLLGADLGFKSAISDATQGVSTLPKITSVRLHGGGDANASSALDQFRVLLHTSEGFYLIKPVETPTTEFPIVLFLTGDHVEELKVCTHC